jgi:hypothetical protein
MPRNGFIDYAAGGSKDFQDLAKREIIEFAREHRNDDTARLLLSAARYPVIDMPAAVQQIEGLKSAREKWPRLLQCEDFLYPPRLNREQASSETTAGYKASLLEAVTVADLTGGMGIDSLAFAAQVSHVDYVERSEQLCSLMEHNCKVLGQENVSVHCADSKEWLASSDCHFDLLFIDPARRSAAGRKVAAFEDCEPNILQHMELLRSRCRWLMVKASPMIDIDLACRQLGDVAEVHIVSVKGECKEVLFVCGPHEGETAIHCIVCNTQGESYKGDFTRSEEAAARPRYCAAVGQYLYEPDSALMKGGPYNLICQWMGVERLASNTNLYTSDRLVHDFPGRIFRVQQEVKLSRKAVAKDIPDGRAHVVVRNYPVAAADLQRQMGLKEGGDLFVIATIVARRRTAFLCQIVAID